MALEATKTLKSSLQFSSRFVLVVLRDKRQQEFLYA